MILYHPELDQTIEVPDSSAPVLMESGWELAAEPDAAPSAFVPEQPKRGRKADQPEG